MDETLSHLQLLNPEQYRAVTTIDGPLLILAGAGSGKTRVLTRRVAHMLHRGVNPANILAVTFTNKAAAEMKIRVSELIGDMGSKVWVSTFHSSCCRILRKDIEALGYTRRFAIYDDDSDEAHDSADSADYEIVQSDDGMPTTASLVPSVLRPSWSISMRLRMKSQATRSCIVF